MAIELWVNLEVSGFLELNLHESSSNSIFDRNCPGIGSRRTCFLYEMAIIGFDIYLNTEVEPFRYCFENVGLPCKHLLLTAD